LGIIEPPEQWRYSLEGVTSEKRGTSDPLSFLWDMIEGVKMFLRDFVSPTHR